MSVRDAYDRWSASYDTSPNATRDLDGERLRAWPLPADADVVEVGCGTGKNSAWLARRVHSLVGLDLSEGMLAVAREKVPSARFLTADVTARWPVDDASADVVLFDLVLEHVADLGAVFREAVRVLRPGGVARVSELHPYRQLRGGRAHFVDGGERVDVPVVVHTVGDYVNAAIGAGLVVQELTEPSADGDDVPRLLILELSRP